MRKKILMIVMITALVLAFAACGGNSSDAKYVGKYKLIGQTTKMNNPADYEKMELQDPGPESTLIISEDGTLILEGKGYKTEGSWEYIDGGIKAVDSNGEETLFTTFDNDKKLAQTTDYLPEIAWIFEKK